MKNRRLATLILMAVALVFLSAVTASGYFWKEVALATDFSRKDLSPSIAFLFGTDWMGRDMFVRTIVGLSLSIRIGLLTAAASAILAFLMGTAAAVMGKKTDSLICGLIDVIMGIPHILLLILISYACGRGFWGVVVGVSLTHWTSLARLIRGEVLQLKESNYIRIAERLGRGRWYIAFGHMAPCLFPQFAVGLVLLFPHAILHEASITFLGFGLSPEQPAIGVILSESMQYLAMGKWWLALFPGILLLVTVLMFHFIGQGLVRLVNPGSAQE